MEYKWHEHRAPMTVVVDSISRYRGELSEPYIPNGDLWNQATRAMQAVFGMPDTCLWCGKPLNAVRVMDVDSWFCCECCPVCNDWPDQRMRQP